ncbi:MAG TPA: hypothetical protein VM571_00115 [Noviherbaspirillum sp.]|nr:hypothetical protein [Noviherbaspirillum sp.]
MNDADRIDDSSAPSKQAAAAQSRSLAELKPKGACWYCNQPLDNVRRFCNKSCADDYRIEDETFNAPPS